MTLSMLGVEIDRIFNDIKIKMTVGELDIKVEDGMDNVKKLVELMNDLTITEAISILYGFTDQIKLKVKEENKKKKLKKLNIELL